MHLTQKNRANLHPHHADHTSTPLAHAFQLHSRGLRKDAEDACRRVLSLDPDCGQAWHLMALIAIEHEQPLDAVQYLKKAIAVEPGAPIHYGNLGYVLNSLRQYSQAESFLRKALEISPDYQDARCNLGLSHYHQNRYVLAAQCFTEILSTDPDHGAALANLGMTHLARQDYAGAVDAYEKAVAVSPDQADRHGNLGAAYVRLGRYGKAARCYRRAAELAPSALDFNIHLGIAMRAAGDLPESIRLLQAVIDKDPGRSMAVSHLVVALEYTCQWDQLDLYHPLLNGATREALNEGRRPDEDPMLNIRRCDDPAVNQAVARAWSRQIRNKAERSGIRLVHSASHPHRQKITIGYLSYDFRNHPVAHQLFPLFGLHDRNRFRTVAFSMGPDDGSLYRQEMKSQCDEFVDLSMMGLDEACQEIYRRRIDILVDLMGHSHHNRMEILALRPAPVQVGYLGFLSTTGAPFIDYLITDEIVVPKNHIPFFDEKLLRMPYCYQFSHCGLIGGETDTRREDWGLPAKGFVFCCFNTVYKIDRELFDTWMRILLRTPWSVLWLNGGHLMARQKMRARARLFGIDPDRLVFSEKIALDDHLRRLPLADLALDTVRYNGGATTANALGCGVPVLTVMGRHWVSRMSASQLIAAGMPDLVFSSIAAYEQAAIDLALDGAKLASVKVRLTQNIPTCDLFDHEGFLRRLETGYEMIWKRYMDGLDPDHMDIPTTPQGAVNE